MTVTCMATLDVGGAAPPSAGEEQEPVTEAGAEGKAEEDVKAEGEEEQVMTDADVVMAAGGPVPGEELEVGGWGDASAPHSSQRSPSAKASLHRQIVQAVTE
jgi:hypothetical protein